MTTTPDYSGFKATTYASDQERWESLFCKGLITWAEYEAKFKAEGWAEA